jgi:hypothetical protein
MAKGDMSQFFPIEIIDVNFAADSGQWDTLKYFAKRIAKCENGNDIVIMSETRLTDIIHPQAWRMCTHTSLMSTRTRASSAISSTKTTVEVY